MGKSALSGPVYGAKSLLAKFSAGAATSTGASTALVCSWIVPPGEDWFVTELSAFCSTCSSLGNTITLKSEGGSTAGVFRDWGNGNNSTIAQTITSVTWGTSTTGPILAVVTPTAGEYEGKWVPTGSTLRAVLSSVVNPIANFNLSVRGYPRFVSSSRSE